MTDVPKKCGAVSSHCGMATQSNSNRGWARPQGTCRAILAAAATVAALGVVPTAALQHSAMWSLRNGTVMEGWGTLTFDTADLPTIEANFKLGIRVATPPLALNSAASCSTNPLCCCLDQSITLI